MITICTIPYIYTTRNQTHSSMTLSRHLSVTSKGKWLPCEYGLYTGCLCPNKKRQSLSAVSEQTLFDGQIKC